MLLIKKGIRFYGKIRNCGQFFYNYIYDKVLTLINQRGREITKAETAFGRNCYDEKPWNPWADDPNKLLLKRYVEIKK